jgi:hypothetical protein
MNSLMENMARTVAVGLGATLAMDLWRFLLLKGLGVSSLDLALLGRWVAYLFRGRVFHKPIAKSPGVNGELVVGWVSHYAIGVGFAGLMPLVSTGWLDSPALLPALAVGVATVLAPWFIMQPAMGLGIAASNLPTPNSVRVRNLAIHTVYGLGLFASAVLQQRLISAVNV